MSQDRERLQDIIRSLSAEELTALRYFLKYRSVGEILASRELKSLGIKNPSRVLTRLVTMGLLKRGIGCYTISRELLEAHRQGVVKV